MEKDETGGEKKNRFWCKRFKEQLDLVPVPVPVLVLILVSLTQDPYSVILHMVTGLNWIRVVSGSEEIERQTMQKQRFRFTLQNKSHS